MEVGPVEPVVREGDILVLQDGACFRSSAHERQPDNCGEDLRQPEVCERGTVGCGSNDHELAARRTVLAKRVPSGTNSMMRSMSSRMMSEKGER